MKTVSEKMGIREGMKAAILRAPANVAKTFKSSGARLSTRLSKDLDFIHFFAKSQDDVRKNFQRLRSHLSDKGMLWISWLKGRNGTDLTLTKLIEIGYDNGLVESKVLSVNDEWAAMKFTHPKEGKVYNNSYGKLKK